MYRQRCSRGFAVTLAILPAMVQMVILLVNGNIGAGVAVAGAFSLVRFRSVPGTAREIGAIFLAMAIGLTTGMGYVALAAIFFVIVAAALVTLSRMDEEESPLKLSDFAVSEAVQETAESFRDFARSQGHPLELAIVPGLTYCGDEYAVRQLVSILLDNAVKYALPETPIRFVLEKGKRGVVLRCSNACTPLAEGETEKLFDRFYRSIRPAPPTAASAWGSPSPGALPRDTTASSGPNALSRGRSCSWRSCGNGSEVPGKIRALRRGARPFCRAGEWDAENSRKNDSF